MQQDELLNAILDTNLAAETRHPMPAVVWGPRDDGMPIDGQGHGLPCVGGGLGGRLISDNLIGAGESRR
jgi:hypothetical protein